MTTIQTADGRLLRASRPAGANLATGSWPSLGPFPPLWSNGETHATDGTTLVSYDRIYRTQPVVATAVDKLARRISTLPFDSYQVADDNSRKMVRGDSLDSLLRRPMPRRTTVHLLAHVAQSLLINANALVAKLRTADRDAPPFMLWPLDWSKVNAYGTPGGMIEWWSTTQFDNTERFIAAADTMHFAWPGPDGGEIGVSPLEKLGVTIQIEDAAQRHQQASFKNGVRPSIAVTLPGDPKESTLQLVREAIERMHKGVDRNAKMMMLAGGATVQPLSMTPVEAALIEQRKLNREEIGMVYDLAGPLMNDLTHGTYSNVAELLKGLYRDVIPPWTELIVQTFQAQLLDPEPAWLDRIVRFDYSDKLKGSPEELAGILKTEVDAGLVSRNEARLVLGYPPEGDPDDQANPANKLTVMANNQAPLAAMAGGAEPAA